MTHRYPTRYQSKVARNHPVPCYDEDKMSEEEIRQESIHNQYEQQEFIFSSLIPYELRYEVETIIMDHYDEKIQLTEQERKEADKIYHLIQEVMSEHSKTKFMTLHYPIISRLQLNIELFTYIKHNYELMRRYPWLANIFHDYYGHFSTLHNVVRTRHMDPSYVSYKDMYLPYCTLLSTLKDVIHNAEMIFIDEGLLKYY